MAEAVFAALPADAAILVAAVADWRVEPSPTKLKKGEGPPQLDFVADPRHPCRARRERSASAAPRRLRRRDRDVVEQAVAKRHAKGADWIVANDVSGDVMGGDRNRVHLITAEGVEDWPEAKQG